MDCKFRKSVKCEQGDSYEMGGRLEYPRADTCIACRLSKLVELLETKL